MAQVPSAALVAVSVIDGDTFRYNGQTIRVADIAMPEVRGRSRQGPRSGW